MLNCTNCRKLMFAIMIFSLIFMGCLQKNVRFPSKNAIPEHGKLLWPVNCKPGIDCSVLFPDIDNDGSHPCGGVGYAGHKGTDIAIGNEVTAGWQAMDRGVEVRAAAEGTVLWVFDGKYDRCVNFDSIFIDDSNPDCKPPSEKPGPNVSSGYLVCTDAGHYCRRDNPNGTCVYCCNGGNVVAIRHEDMGEIFITLYMHLKNGSIVVKPGERVSAGQKIAEVGSSGRTGGPHLHFEVWRDFNEPIDPWPADCNSGGLWQYE
ncbi:MAG: M23 family metallopeptidase [Candidatus Micrarchaeia archaeon]